jgi:hypothetical protein
MTHIRVASQIVYFDTKTPQCLFIFSDLGMENVCAFYGHSVYFIAIWVFLWSFGIYFPNLGMLHREKSGNPY